MEEFDKGDIVSYQGRKAIVLESFYADDKIMIEFMEYDQARLDKYVPPRWAKPSDLELIEKSTHIDFPAYCKMQFAKF